MGIMNTQGGTRDNSTEGKTSRMFGRFSNSKWLTKLRYWPLPEKLPEVRQVCEYPVSDRTQMSVLSRNLQEVR